jgi:exonuclease VII large subunit
LVGATARAAESASHAAERVCDRVDDLSVKLDSYIFESQRLFTRDGERLTIQEGQSERLEAIAASLTRNHEQIQQQIQIQQQRMELQQQQMALQQQQLDIQRQRLDTQDETLKSINAAVERLEAIVNRLIG